MVRVQYSRYLLCIMGLRNARTMGLVSEKYCKSIIAAVTFLIFLLYFSGIFSPSLFGNYSKRTFQ